jgi:serine phosphatase RsbU (regulator of sigma subunit)
VSLPICAQHFNIDKVCYDNILFETKSLQDVYQSTVRTGINIESIEKIVNNVEAFIKNNQLTETDVCTYTLLRAQQNFLMDEDKLALKNALAARQIASKLNNEALQNASSVLLSKIFGETMAYYSAIYALKNCKNLKPHEIFQVQFMQSKWQNLLGDFNTASKSIKDAVLSAKILSNYDYHNTIKEAVSLLSEKTKDYKKALEYCLLDQNILEHFAQGDAYSSKLDYTSKPQIDEEYLLFEKISLASEMGAIYRIINQNDESKEILLNALKLANGNKLNKNFAFLYCNLGLTHTKLKAYAEADLFYKKALGEYEKEKNNSKIAETYNLIAKNSFLKNEQQESLSACQNAIKSAQAISDYRNLATAHYILSELYTANTDYINSQKNYKLFTEFSNLNEKRNNDKNEKTLKASSDMRFLASVFEKDMAEIKKSELELIRIRLESSRKEQELLLLKKENEINEKTLTNQQLEKEQALKSLALIKDQLAMEKLSKDYEKINQEKEIKGFENEKNKNKIKLLNSQKTIYEKEKIVKDFEIENNKRKQALLIVGLLLIAFVAALMAFAWYRNSKQKKIIELNNKELEKFSADLRTINTKLQHSIEEINTQKQIIEDKNRLVVESINYSSRIQKSLLLQGNELPIYFNDAFVINMPRDIVGGDFYLVKNKGHKTYVAMVDCTGHGVPGSLISILGYQEINHIINTHALSPAETLKVLNTNINRLVNNSNPSSLGSDGMDVMLLEIDPATRTITFAGARSYLLLYTNNQFKEFKGDRVSIGESNESDINFTNVTIPIFEQDIIFLYTDGLQDQQNDFTKKRIGSKAVKQTIYQNIQLPLVEQKEKLMDLYHNNTSNSKQTDDITVLAFQPKLTIGANQPLNENPKIREVLNKVAISKSHLENLMVVYGKINQDVIISTMKLMETKLLVENFSKAYITRVKMVSIEMLQNISKHQEFNEQITPYFIVNVTKQGLELNSGNSVSAASKDYLREKLELYKQLDKTALRAVYLDKFNSGVLTEKGNAGLGLLTIAYSSDQNIKHELTPLSNNMYHYNLEVYLDNKQNRS